MSEEQRRLEHSVTALGKVAICVIRYSLGATGFIWRTLMIMVSRSYYEEFPYLGSL